MTMAPALGERICDVTSSMDSGECVKETWIVAAGVATSDDAVMSKRAW